MPSKIIDKLLEHDWPGNVRELENVIQRAVLMSRNNIITENELVFDDVTADFRKGDYFGEIVNKLPDSSLKDVLYQFESDVISHVLKENKGNVLVAARQLEIGKTALYDKMKRHDISAKTLKK